MFATKTRTSERRRAKRMPLNAPGELLVCPASSKTVAMRVTVKDVSATGVGVIAAEPLPIGQKYVVKEPTISRRQSVLFTVVRSHAIGDGQYLAGLHASNLMRGNDARDVRRSSGRGKTLAAVGAILAAVGFVVASFIM